uniref:P-type domain-containing protein n=1 Tax=Steinernema glaseri TaxID=37863 RepID=A0A1I7ZU03_9BILA
MQEADVGEDQFFAVVVQSAASSAGERTAGESENVTRSVGLYMTRPTSAMGNDLWCIRMDTVYNNLHRWYKSDEELVNSTLIKGHRAPKGNLSAKKPKTSSTSLSTMKQSAHPSIKDHELALGAISSQLSVVPGTTVMFSVRTFYVILLLLALTMIATSNAWCGSDGQACYEDDQCAGSDIVDAQELCIDGCCVDPFGK